MSFASELRQAGEPSHTVHGEMESEEGAAGTRHPFAKAFVCAGATCAAIVGLLALNVGRDATPSELLEATVNVVLLLMVPCASLAAITGLIVYSSPRIWPLWRIALAFVSLFVLMLVFLLITIASL